LKLIAVRPCAKRSIRDGSELPLCRQRAEFYKLNFRGGAPIATHCQRPFRIGRTRNKEQSGRDHRRAELERTSSFSFKGKSEDIPTIGKKLNVANILEGSVRKSGNRLRVTTQLIRASNGEHLWSETYDRELTDVLKVQDEIAAAVGGGS
jgi:hypothetical protein